MPLLRALKWINGFVGNYGWSIIVLTILINLAMFPLRHKSVVSMRKMQELQPQMKAIQDRYAKLKVTDPERAEDEHGDDGALREKGVNPASGCVPMLLTMPVLFAFYSMLSVRRSSCAAPPFVLLDPRPLAARSVLHHAAADGRDDVLAAEDDAGTADPAQQKMMMLMPVMFLLHVPLGAERARDLLVGQQPARHRPAVLHELDDRPAGGADGRGRRRSGG